MLLDMIIKKISKCLDAKEAYFKILRWAKVVPQRVDIKTKEVSVISACIILFTHERLSEECIGTYGNCGGKHRTTPRESNQRKL